MSEEHQHQPNVYIIYLRERHWWGGVKTLRIVGTQSSKKENEILIWKTDGGFWSLNYDQVRRVEVTPVQHA